MRVLLYRWLPVAILLILVILGYTVGTKQPPRIRTVQPGSVKDSEASCSGVELRGFDAEAHYSPIIENNLFRPLGWRPNRPTERYRILGTIIPTTAERPPKAIIQTTIGHQTYIVTPGQKLDATTEVIDIQSKRVTLSKDGIHRTLQLPSAF